MKTKGRIISAAFALALLTGAVGATTLYKPTTTISVPSEVGAETIPAGAIAISSATELQNFLNGTTSGTYGYLKTNITGFSWGSSVYGSSVEFAQGRTLNGNGHTITLTPPAGGGGSWPNYASASYENNTLTDLNGNALTNSGHVTTIKAGGMFLAANKGTIKNINFVLNNSVQYQLGTGDVLGSFGVVTGINWGTIDNCTLDIPSGKEVHVHKIRSNSSTKWYSWLMIGGGFSGIDIGNISNVKLTLNGTLDFISKGYQQTTPRAIYKAKVNAGGITGAVYGGKVNNVIINGSGTLTGRTIWTSGQDFDADKAYQSIGYVAGSNMNGETGVGEHCGNTFIPSSAVPIGTIDNVYVDASINLTHNCILGNTNKGSSSGVIVGDTPDANLTNVYISRNCGDRVKASTAYHTSATNYTLIDIDSARINGSGANSIYFQQVNGEDKLTLSLTPSDTSTKFFYNISDGTTTYADYSSHNSSNENATVNTNRSLYDVYLRRYGSFTTPKSITAIEGTYYKSGYTFSASKTYDGKAPAVPTSLNANGKTIDGVFDLDASFTFTVADSSPNAGQYTLTLKPTGTNDYVYVDKSNKVLYMCGSPYTGTYTGTSTINKRPITLTYSGYENLIYDNTVKTVSASINNMVSGQSFDIDLAITGQNAKREPLTELKDAGTYTLTPTLVENGSASLSNYEFVVLDNTLLCSIAQREVKIKYGIIDGANLPYKTTQEIGYTIVDKASGELLSTAYPNIPELKSKIYYYNADSQSENGYTELGTYTAKVKLGYTADSLSYNLDDNLKYVANELNYSIIKADPEYGELPIFESKTYNPGEHLSDLELPTNENGVWSWKNGDIVPSVDQTNYTLIFTPNDQAHYNTIEVDAQIIRTPATPIIDTTQMQRVYDYTGSDIVINSGAKTSNASEIDITYSNNILRNQGTYTVTVTATPKNNNYIGTSTTVEITINSVNVNLEVELNQPIFVGQSLDDTFITSIQATFNSINVDGTATIAWKNGAPIAEDIAQGSVVAYPVVITFTPANESEDYQNYKVTTIEKTIDVEWIKVLFTYGYNNEKSFEEYVEYDKNVTGPSAEDVQVLGFTHAYSRSLTHIRQQGITIESIYSQINYTLDIQSNINDGDYTIQDLPTSVHFNNAEAKFSLKRAYSTNKKFVGYYIDSEKTLPLQKENGLELYSFTQAMLAQVDTTGNKITIYLVFEDYEELPISLSSSRGENFEYSSTNTVINYSFNKNASYTYNVAWYKDNKDTVLSTAEYIEIGDVIHSGRYIVVLTESLDGQIINTYETYIDINITPISIKAVIDNEFTYNGTNQPVSVILRKSSDDSIVSINKDLEILQNDIAASFVNAGNYKLKITLDTKNYELVASELDLIMKQADAVVQSTNLEKTFDWQTTKFNDYTVTGIGDDVIDYSVTYYKDGVSYGNNNIDVSNAGIYTMVIEIAGNLNYKDSTHRYTLTINKADLSESDFSGLKSVLFANEPLAHASTGVSVTFLSQNVEGAFTWTDERASSNNEEKSYEFTFTATNGNFNTYTGAMTITTNPIVVTFYNQDKSQIGTRETVYENAEGVIPPELENHCTATEWKFYDADTQQVGEVCSSFVGLTDNISVIVSAVDYTQYTIILDAKEGEIVDLSNVILEDGVYKVNYTFVSDEIALPNIVTKTGYTFVKWQDENENKVTSIATGSYGNKTYTAIYTPVEYTITFNANGGTINESYTGKYTIESQEITLPTDVTKTGYTFVEWQDELGNKVTSIPSGSIGNKAFTAKYTPVEYTITFNANGGTINDSCTGKYTIESAEIILPTNVTKEGYTFVEWQDENEDKVTSIATGSYGNKSYTAIFTPVEYTITFNVDGGTINDSYAEKYTIESDEIILPTNVTKTGYTFVEWQDELGDKVTSIPSGSIGNKEFTAIYTLVEYTITFNANGGTINESYSEKYTIESEQITLPTNVTKEGYTFVEWQDENKNKVTSIATGSYGNRTYTAIYSISNPTNIDITTDYTGPVTFGESVRLNAICDEIEGLIYSYEWRKNSIDGEVVSHEKSLTLTQVADSGEYFLTVTVSDGEQSASSNYNKYGGSFGITINKDNVIVELAPIDLTYNNTDFKEAILNKLTVKGEVSEVDLSATIKFFKKVDGVKVGDELVSIVDAGDYIIEITREETDNYNSIKATDTIKEFTIKQKEFDSGLVKPGTDEKYEVGTVIANFTYGDKIENIYDTFYDSVCDVDKNDVSIKIYKLQTQARTEMYVEVNEIKLAGKYKIVLTINNANYNNVSFDYYVIVNKKTLTLNKDAFNITFNDTTELPNKVSGLVEDDKITLGIRYIKEDGTVLTERPVNAGKYKVEVSFEGNELYEAFETFTYEFTIKAKEVELIWENLDNPVKNNEFIVNCYYIDVNDELVMVNIVGGTTESGEVTLEAVIEDSNYFATSRFVTIKIQTPLEKFFTTKNIIIISVIAGIVFFIILIPLIVRSRRKKKIKELTKESTLISVVKEKKVKAEKTPKVKKEKQPKAEKVKDSEDKPKKEKQQKVKEQKTNKENASEKKALKETKAREAAEAKAKAQAEMKAKKEAELNAKKEAQAKAKAEKEAKIQEQAKARAEAKAAQEAKAKELADAKAKKAAEEKAAREAEAQRKAKEKADLEAKKQAELKAKKEAAEKAKEEARIAKETKAKEIAETKAKAQAEMKAKKETELNAKREAQAKAKAEKEARIQEQAKARAEAKTAQEAKAKELADAKAKKAAEEKVAREAEAQRKAKEKADLEAKKQAELKAKKEAAEKAKEEARIAKETQAKEMAEAKAKAQAEMKAKKEAEVNAKKEAQAKAKAEKEEKIQEEAKARAEAKAAQEAKAKELADAKAKKAAEEKAAREAEAQRKAKEKADLEAKRQAELKAKKEAAEKAKEEARIAKETKAKEMAEAKPVKEIDAQKKTQAKVDQDVKVQREEKKAEMLKKLEMLEKKQKKAQILEKLDMLEKAQKNKKK